MIQVKTNSSELAQLFAAIGPEKREAVLKKIGFLVARDAKANARAKGGKFWGDIANSVSYQTDGDSVVVGASHEASAHKHFGGMIEAPGKGPGSKKAAFLTIPLDKISKGKSVGELRTAMPIFRLGRRGPAKDGDILATYELDGGGKKGKIIPLYVLKKRVFHKPDPWFPTSAQIFKSIKQVVAFFLKG